MAADDITAAEPRAGESSRDPEKAEGGNGTGQLQPEGETQPSPPLPPRPLPASHQETLKHQSLLAPPHGVHFGPLPLEQGYDSVQPERPFYPRWHKTKLALLLLSLMVSAVIFGLGIALGFYNAPYYLPADGYIPVDYEFGISGTAAGLAIVITAIEFLKTVFSTRREGMHPGALVAFHLIIWLLALAAAVVISLFTAYSSPYDWYDYPSYNRSALHSQSQVYEQAMLAFDIVLLLIHFILFVGACVETNRVAAARKKVVVVRVPVQVGAEYPGGGQYPLYGPPQPFVPQPGSLPGQYPVPLMAQVPPQQAGDGTGPAPPQPATLYGGYYAPAPQGWAPQQQPGAHGPLMQGYYAPAPVPGAATSNPSRRSQRGPPAAPALATSSGSRRSQRHAQAQAGQQPEATAQLTEPQAQAEPVSERNA
ncbi:hypothetical protein C8A01DRAFT_31751 [Parachaetomium inaequale]|uniref:Uncharacterized protein n=1 Tax=Parachaetomium inaequale TaxID=2588326 RepID=A0AAN6SV11_9PEZI|nr:hypothetical protein C8A01DRAFT_31751 [Parachaetomium inaequale]